MGISKVISTSKIKKITVIMKKCMENGIRALFLGSNPHSKGEDFSRSEKVFLEIIVLIVIIITPISVIITPSHEIIMIIYTNFRSLDWKSSIIFILYKFIYLISR